MSNNCIYLKQKLNRKVVCKLDESRKVPNDCANCPLKKRKCTIYQKKCANYHFPDNRNPIKNRTSKLAKLERNRESLFTDNKHKCMFCPSTYNLSWHEIYPGRNRQNSMKYKLCLRMCEGCHSKYQEDVNFNNHWRKKGQAMFNKTYPDLDFEDIFKRNYL